MGEIKKHPYTSVTALACFIALLFGGPFIWTQKADASDMQALARQITQVDESVKRESAQGELNAVQRELFQISMRINELERGGHPVDMLLYQRREQLVAAERQLEAKLAAMDRKQ